MYPGTPGAHLSDRAGRASAFSASLLLLPGGDGGTLWTLRSPWSWGWSEVHAPSPKASPQHLPLLTSTIGCWLPRSLKENTSVPHTGHFLARPAPEAVESPLSLLSSLPSTPTPALVSLTPGSAGPSPPERSSVKSVE